MKVLVISAAFPPMRAGEADHTLHLCQHLSDHGLSVNVLTTKTNQTKNNLPFKVYPLIRNWSWVDLLTLARFLKLCSPDAVMLLYSGWIYNDHPMITFAPTICKALLPHTTFVTQFEIAEDSFRASIPTRIIRKIFKQWAGPKSIDYSFGTLLRDSDRSIVLSEHHLASFSEHLPGVESKAVVIPPPPLIHFSTEGREAARRHGRERLGLSSKDFVIAYFGYVDQTKGVETLLKAFQIVISRAVNVRLVMIGGGRGVAKNCSHERNEATHNYEMEMYKLAKQLDIADRVTWTSGYDSDSEEASLFLHAADSCVLPYDEGVTLNRSSLGAAAAHGLPIITTRGKVMESAFVEERNVLLCPPKNPRALAIAIESLIHNPVLRQRLHEGALKLASEWFSWDKAVERTIETLNGIK